MTKAEVLNDIIYDLKMREQADFEADDKSYFVCKVTDGYVISGIDTFIPLANLSEVRKRIPKLGKKLLWL